MNRETTQTQNLNVNNLCSRRLVEILKNREWCSDSEQAAIKRELLQRRHYLKEIGLIEPVGTARH